jgi:chromosome segregation ATPase
MFPILNFELVHWDYWQRVSLPLDAPIVTIVGPNGSGKTTLLDGLRTLLGQDCSKKREYKRYARKSGQPYSWLRAVIDNRRHGHRTHPFFPILGDRVTLACRIERKGGDWTREYCVAEGEQEIEQLAAGASWLGLREYQRRLEHAGLSRAIARVLSLEQGQTDKLCEYSPRELLDLVFHVFGDKAVLERYQEARDHQRQTALELREIEGQLQRLAAEVEKLNGQVNRYREWKRLTDERIALTGEIQPRIAYHETRESIRMGRVQLAGKRREYAAAKAELATLDARLPQLQAAADRAGTTLVYWDKELERQQEGKEAAQRRETRAATILERRDQLVEAAKLAGNADAEELARQLELRRQRDDHLRLQIAPLQQRLEELDDAIPRLLRGERADPAEVRALRVALDAVGIAHHLLPEIVEVEDDTWQTAVEALLAPYRHLVLLEHADNQAQAFAIGEKLRYRHFIVPDSAVPPAPTFGSVHEVIRFSRPAPPWLAQLLDRTQRVKDAVAGSRLPRGQDWITQDGYLRERRGGRHAATTERHFGRARLAALQAERTELAGNLKTLDEQRRKAQADIADINAALAGAKAPEELAAHSEEFARAERERKDARDAVATLIEKQNAAYAERRTAQEAALAARLAQATETQRRAPLEKTLADAANRPAREEQARRIQKLRHDRAKLPQTWKNRAANAELVAKWGSETAVRREIERIEQHLREGEWITDESVIALRDLRKEDLERQTVEQERRAAENRRAGEQTDSARGAYIEVLRHTLRGYGHNLKTLGQLASVGVEIVMPRLENDDATLAQAGLDVRFDFDEKGYAGLNDGEASGGQQVIKSLILLIGLMMDTANEGRPGGFVFIDEPFAHLDIMNIDRVAAFLKATRAQYLITTPITHNVNVYDPAMLTLVTYKKKPGETWAPRIARLVREPADG